LGEKKGGGPKEKKKGAKGPGLNEKRGTHTKGKKEMGGKRERRKKPVIAAPPGYRILHLTIQ